MVVQQRWKQVRRVSVLEIAVESLGFRQTGHMSMGEGWDGHLEALKACWWMVLRLSEPLFACLAGNQSGQRVRDEIGDGGQTSARALAAFAARSSSMMQGISGEIKKALCPRFICTPSKDFQERPVPSLEATVDRHRTWSSLWLLLIVDFNNDDQASLKEMSHTFRFELLSSPPMSLPRS